MPHPFPVGAPVRLTKLRTCIGGPSIDSVAVNHWVAGFVAHEPAVGEPLVIARFLTNDRLAPGTFCTSPVAELNLPFIVTQNNSLYRLELLTRAEVFS